MNFFATALASTALAAASAAQAQDGRACITESEVASLMIYAVPSAVTGIKTACGPRLAPNGFLATHGDAFAARYGTLQDARWPEAKSGFLKFGRRGPAKEVADNLAMLASLPDTTIRPIVDAVISGKIAQSVAVNDCGKIERGMELLAGMDPAQTGALVAFAMGLTKPKNPSVCPASGAPPRAP